MVNAFQLSPNCPDQAGFVIQQMAIEVLSPDSPRSAIKLLVLHLQQKGMRVDRTRVSAWCNGHFLDNRQMTIEQFQEIVNIFWHRPGGIQTVAEIFALAGCIGKISCGQQTFDLAKNLDDQWLLSFGHQPPGPLENIHIPDDRYPSDPFTLPRENIVAKLTHMLNSAGLPNRPIVIFGQPGTGKSRLISHLAYSPWGQQFEKKRVIYLNGGGLESYLRLWYQEIHGFPPPLGIRLEDLANTIRREEKDTRQIVLVDAVSHLRFIQPILEIFKDTRSMVILTPYRGLAIQGLQTEKHLTLTLPGFTLTEAVKLYEKRGANLKPEDFLDFKALHKTLKGNPLALYYAFQNIEAEGLARLVSLLNSADTDIPQEMLKEIFLSLQVGFERLPPCLQKSFARLGAMKRFHLIDPEVLAALWANSPEEINLEKTGMLVNQLQISIGPFEPVHGQSAQWRLHEQTHLFAKSKLDETEPGEQVLASQWFVRTVQSGNLSMPTTSLAEAAKTHLTARFQSDKPIQINRDEFFRLLQLLVFGIDPGREVIEHHIHRLTSYEYFVAQTLDQRAFSRRKWFWLWQIDLIALLVLNLLFSKNRWASLLEGLLMLVFILLYGRLCCALTKSTCLWSLLWRQVSKRNPADGQTSA